jgi:hypothetical protein
MLPEKKCRHLNTRVLTGDFMDRLRSNKLRLNLVPLCKSILCCRSQGAQQ